MFIGVYIVVMFTVVHHTSNMKTNVALLLVACFLNAEAQPNRRPSIKWDRRIEEIADSKVDITALRCKHPVTSKVNWEDIRNMFPSMFKNKTELGIPGEQIAEP